MEDVKKAYETIQIPILSYLNISLALHLTNCYKVLLIIPAYTHVSIDFGDSAMKENSKCQNVIDNYYPQGFLKPLYPEAKSTLISYFDLSKPMNLAPNLYSAAMTKGWKGWSLSSPLTLNYTFDVSGEVAEVFEVEFEYAYRKSLNIDHDIALTKIEPTQIQVVRQAMNIWEKFLNVKFNEVNSLDSIKIYQFKFDKPTTEILNLVNCDLTNPNRNKFPLGLYDYEGYLFINGDYFNSCQNSFPERSLQVTLHELGHALGYDHLFELDPSLRFTTDSIMNYAASLDRVTGRHIFPTTPMPLDMVEGNYWIGQNPNANKGNTLYNTADFKPKGKNYKTISALWDVDGEDTLIVEKSNFNNLLNLRQNTRSDLGDSYLVIPENVIIENAVLKNNHTIVLNQANNHIYIESGINSTIVIDSQECGNDIIEGFNPRSTKIVLERLPASPIGDWKIIPTYCDTQRISGHFDTKIYFDKDNSICLKNVNLLDLNSNNFYSSESNEVLQCQMFKHDESIPLATQEKILELFADYPQKFLEDLMRSLKYGIAIQFLISLTKQQCRKYHFSEHQITMLFNVIQCLLMIASGKTLASCASFLTSNVFAYLGHDTQKCLLAGIVASELCDLLLDGNVDKLLLLPSKLLANYVVSRVSSSLSKFGIWASSYFQTKNDKDDLIDLEVERDSSTFLNGNS